MINVIIREEKPEDYEKVCRLIEAAFRDVEESDHTEHLLVKRLRNSEAYIPELSLVAQTPQGEIVGHILLTKAQIVNNTRSFEVLALAPLSVLPTFQRNLIGSRLIQRAHQKAAELGYPAIVLLGHKDYYPRFRYKKASQFAIRFPFEAPDECCMVAELRTNALKGISGTVSYAKAFFD